MLKDTAKSVVKGMILKKLSIPLCVVGFIMLLVVLLMACFSMGEEESASGTGTTGAICTNGTYNMDVLKQKVDAAGTFSGHTDDFIQAGQKNQVDPILLISIAFHETGFGKSRAVREYNNPGGIMDWENAMRTIRRFGTLGEGIDFMARNLYKNYISQGLTTIEQIGKKYAPVGADNDPFSQNQYWIPTISKLVNEMGGLSMNCQVIGGTGGTGSTAGGDLVIPTPTFQITSKFGGRDNPTGSGGQFHKGLDLACKKGEPLKAAREGKVEVAIPSGWGGGYGHHVVLNHGDYYTLYGHMTEVQVSMGSSVSKGQQIGTCGTTGDSTGPHLHFEIQFGKPYGQRVDPEPYLKGEKKS